MKKRKTELRDPRRQVGEQWVGGYKRRIMERTQFPCEKKMAQLLLQFDEKDIVAVMHRLSRWNETQLAIMARFGVAVKG